MEKVAERFSNVPAELRALPRWAGFKVWRDEKEEKLKKMPVDIKATIAAKKAEPNHWKDLPAESNNPATWCSFDEAVGWLKSKRPHKRNAWHIGFAFNGDGIAGIDLDKCVGEDGALSDFAREILAAVPSYAEYSPSGKGVHIIAKCSAPFSGGGLHRKEIEIYGSGRFFTMTGNRLEGSPAELVDCTEAVLGIYEKHKCSLNADNSESGLLPMTPEEAEDISRLKQLSTGTMSDDEVIRRAGESRRAGDKFTALFRGDWQGQGFPSQSEADMALCTSLAFWTGKDYRQINNIFRRSGLFRDKWDKVHYAGGVTYGERTVAEAISKCRSVYKDNGRGETKPGSGDNGIVNNVVSGVFVQGNAYYMDKGKDIKRLTNFKIIPCDCINVDGEKRMTAMLFNMKNQLERVSLRFSDFNSVSAFRNAVGANDLRFSVICSDTELQHIKDHVAEQPCPEKRCFKGIGIDFTDDGKPVFVCSDGAFGEGYKPVADIVQAPDSVKITSGIHNVAPIDKDALHSLAPLLLGFNELPKAAAVLCWAAACFKAPPYAP